MKDLVGMPMQAIKTRILVYHLISIVKIFLMNIRYYAFSAMLLFAVTSCKKETGTQTEKLAVDSVKVSDSIALSPKLSLGYANKLLVFPSIKDRPMLDSIYFQYPTLKDFTKEGIEKFVKNDEKSFFETTKKDVADWLRKGEGYMVGKWYEDADMKVVSNENDFLHIRYSSASYMGGAHDNYDFSERVFDLKNKKMVHLSDITTMSSEELSKILRKNIDKKPGSASDDKGRIASSDMLIVDKIPATGNFYFDNQNLYFHYSPYEITAFAAGDITIPISWKELSATLKPEFKERMNLK